MGEAHLPGVTGVLGVPLLPSVPGVPGVPGGSGSPCVPGGPGWLGVPGVHGYVHTYVGTELSRFDAPDATKRQRFNRKHCCHAGLVQRAHFR